SLGFGPFLCHDLRSFFNAGQEARLGCMKVSEQTIRNFPLSYWTHLFSVFFQGRSGVNRGYLGMVGANLGNNLGNSGSVCFAAFTRHLRVTPAMEAGITDHVWDNRGNPCFVGPINMPECRYCGCYVL